MIGVRSSADDPDAQATDPLRPKLVADNETQTTPAGHKLQKKILNDMAKRNWTAEQIDEAVRSGPRIDAVNKATGAPATRYENPTTGRSVVIHDTTNEVMQVGREDFIHSVESGDAPGAVMRPPPGATGSEGGGGGGGGGGPAGGFGGGDPFGHNPSLIPGDEEPLY